MQLRVEGSFDLAGSGFFTKSLDQFVHVNRDHGEQNLNDYFRLYLWHYFGSVFVIKNLLSLNTFELSSDAKLGLLRTYDY